MQKIAYLLHHFPGITDTFIRREIRSLQEAGTEVEVVSVWQPRDRETTPEILSEWLPNTHFVLPRPAFSVLTAVISSAIRYPGRFLATASLAYSTSRPGIRGLVYQSFYFVQALLAAEILRRRAVSHVHNHIGDQSGTVTMLAARLAGIDYSITFHGWPVFFDAKYSRIKEKVLGARFTRSISYFCRSQLMMFSECEDPVPFKVVHCGLIIEKYKYTCPRERIYRVFCAARLSPEKGHCFSIQALKLLKSMGLRLELRLAGDGPSRALLEKLSMELGISDQVQFLGNLTEDQIANELEAADLFLLSSFVEGIPVSAMEAMAVGVPVIATNVAGTSELIEDGRSGLLVRPADPQALADAVVRMINDYPFRLRASKLGRQKVEDEFDVGKETAKLNDYLLESCRGENKPPDQLANA
jgi:colanic acid/amylovoran biosynthesis glycosyltransferase